MASHFNARSAENYEYLMGRWSRRLAPLFIAHAGLADGESVLDVGCGTGSLTFALAAHAGLRAITAIDFAQIYVDFTRARATDPRLTIEQGNATDLRFADASFDRALTMLVLQFVPDPAKAVAEMRRVTRPGGTVAAAVWDTPGGMPGQRMFWDIAVTQDQRAAEHRNRAMQRPAAQPGGLAHLFAAAGLTAIEQTSLTIRMDYDHFEDYWNPILAGEGSLGAYLTSLEPPAQQHLRDALSEAYRAGAPDGPRSFAAVAWSCRGVVGR